MALFPEVAHGDRFEQPPQQQKEQESRQAGSFEDRADSSSGSFTSSSDDECVDEPSRAQADAHEAVRRRSLIQLKTLTRSSLTKSIVRKQSKGNPKEDEQDGIHHTTSMSAAMSRSLDPIDLDNGYVTDYVERLRGQVLRTTRQNFFSRVSRADTAFADGSVLNNIRFLSKHIPGLRAAVPMLHQERLIAEMNEALHAAEEQQSSRSQLALRLRQRITDLVKAKRAVRCLEQETGFWQLRRVTMLRKPQIRTSEKDDDRRLRLAGFWADLHESPQRPSLWWKCEEKIQRPGTPGSPLRTALGLGYRLKKPIVGSPLRRELSDWKARPARSRCTQGGWNMAEKQRSLMQSSSEPWLLIDVQTSGSLRHVHGLDEPDVEESVVGQEQQASLQTTLNLPKRLVQEPRSLQSWHLRPNFNRRNDGATPTEQEDPLAARMFKRTQARYKPATVRSDMSTSLIMEKKVVPEESDDLVLPLIHQNRYIPVEEARGIPSKGGPGAPAKRYLRECKDSKVVPILLPFVTGHSRKLIAKGRVLTDVDIAAVGATARGMLHIEELDFEDNSALTDRGLVPFLHMLHTHPATSALEHLSLHGCIRAGPATAEVICELLEGPCGKLRHLDLSGIQLGQRARRPICKAVKDHPGLRSVFLADTGFSGEDTAANIDMLCGSVTLEELDLGWNCFTEDVYRAMGRRLLETQSVKTLGLANSATASARITPIVDFMEIMAKDKVLTKLDLSMNHIDHRAALVIEDSLQSHPVLKEMNISNNPLGTIGLRCLLRLLARNDSSLLHFRSRDCDGDFEGDEQEKLVLNATNPSGTYYLDMESTYHRALLRMLLKTLESFGLTNENAIRLTGDGDAGFRSRQGLASLDVGKDSAGLWVVPDVGRFNVVVTIDRTMEASSSSIEAWDLGGVLRQHCLTTHFRPGFHKVAPLIAMWRSLAGSVHEQRLFLDAIAKDFLLTPAFVEVLCDDSAMAVDVLARLVPNIDGPTYHRYLIMMRLTSVGDYCRLMSRLQSFFLFNPDNPTGHYSLDLGDPVDYAVAEQLLLIDRWEASIARQLNRVDVSQRRNGSNFRNEHHQGNPLTWLPSMAEWLLPQSDILEFDYCSGKRQRQGTASMDNDTFDRVFLALLSSKCKSMDQVQVLRIVSHRMRISSMQFRQLLVIYEDDKPRSNIFTVLYFRIVDVHNAKVFRVRFENHEELHRLHRMLGKVTCFPFIQPDQAHFEYDFRFWDERLACNILFQLCAREGWSNLQHPSFVHEDGKLERLEAIPKAWEVLDRMPTSGTFRGAYMCAPEDREFKLRKRLMERYGFWDTTIRETDVRWWTSLQDSPAEVRDFLTWVVVGYTDVNQVLDKLSGGTAHVAIGFADFVAGLRGMGCKKFAAYDEEERLRKVFDFMDRNQTGFITKPKWRILEQLWRELHYSINEFCIFIERAFGKGFKKPWAFLDKDKDGVITEMEWTEACQQIGYFGHAMPIFQFLDKDDEGTVNFSNFQTLQVFRSYNL